MAGEKFDRLAAEKKLRMLLQAMNAPVAIPAKYADRAAFATSNKWSDSASALASVRHGYVHANKRNRKVVLAAPKLATFQAWQLSLWLQELALLHLLNHRGEYRNRVTAEWLGIVESVPCHVLRKPFRDI